MKKLLAVLLLAAVPSVAQNFDQSLDIKSVLAEARVQPTQIGRWDSDCADVSLRGSETESRYVDLRSTEWVEDCIYIPGDPRRGGGGRQCHTRPGRTYRASVRVRLTERKELLPWESDTFSVCLNGPWMDARPRATAYKYRETAANYSEVTFAPGEKVRMKPDAAGLKIESLSPALLLTLKDRWASYYAGEKLKVHLTLNEEIRNWPDSTIATMEGEMTAAETTRIQLGSDPAVRGKLKPGKKYYVKVSFQRLNSALSTDAKVSAGESSPVAYQPAAPSLASAD